MSRKKQSVALAAMPKPSVPIKAAANALASVCELIDGGANPRDAIVKVMFADGQRQLRDCIDEHIALKAFVEGAAATAKDIKAAWEAKRKQLFAIAAEIDAVLKGTIEEKPDLPYRGTIGSLAVHKNPPKVDLAWGDDTSLDDDRIALFAIDERYIRTERSLDMATVLEDLKVGVELPWATLIQNTRLAVTT